MDNTLLNYTQSELDAMKRTTQDHGLFVDDEPRWAQFWSTYIHYNYQHWTNFVNKLGAYDSIEDVLIRSFRDALSGSDELHRQLSHSYWQYFCNTCHFEDGAMELLHTLKEQYKLGIITNGISEAQRKRLAAGEISGMFESIVISDEAGVRKPEREIFAISLDELNLHRHEVLFIGDSLADDYQGARNAGIDFCLYNKSGSTVPAEYRPKYIIDELSELLQLIGA